MRLPRLAIIMAAASGAVALGSVSAETVKLKNGNTVTGQVVADKAEFLAVDLGYTILQIPRANIESVFEDDASGDETTEESTEGKLYRTAKLKRRTVRELVDTFGQGLVKVLTPKGVGSGFIINEDGYVITNAHVIQGETRVSVILFLKQGESLGRRTVKDVEICAVNPTVDLALLKFGKPDDVELCPLYFGDIERVRTGEPVFAIGNPLGLDRSVSEGIVSQKSRQVARMLVIQTTAPINPGNSGGPLLNMRGEVIGVTNMKVGVFAEGLGFAVPINYVKEFLEYRGAYAYDKDNPNSGYHYLEPPHRQQKGEEKSEQGDQELQD